MEASGNLILRKSIKEGDIFMCKKKEEEKTIT
jgi:hypothetical protein